SSSSDSTLIPVSAIIFNDLLIVFVAILTSLLTNFGFFRCLLGSFFLPSQAFTLSSNSLTVHCSSIVLLLFSICYFSYFFFFLSLALCSFIFFYFFPSLYYL